jgi:uncharacterized protein with GYD domain
MNTYLTFFSYTKSAWREMVQHPEDREAAARGVIEASGGRLLAFYWMFGEYDGLAIYASEDAVTAATVQAGIVASGRIEGMTTHALLSGSEARRVLELAKSAAADYVPPGGRSGWHSDFESRG